ncbi:CMRF35-like molecule 5 isoform X8 [Anarhichas minor]|uniref:CMRF35-like molecule 5 isoform X8 n=1 Tax=Anarhichas minor TaxID=65739 RepID=UPI003F739874
MDVRQTLICFFFFTALRGRNTGLINAEIISTGTEGGNITVACIFTFSARKKIFCKQPCEEGDILIETEDVTAQRGRYSITYTEGAYPVRSTVLYVSITKLTKSDAGKYRCGLHRSLPLPSYQDIEIRVEEASVPSASTQTTTQLSSSTGSYTPSSASPEGTQQSQKEQTPAAATGVLLYVRLTLVIMIIVLSTAVLIICRKRASEPKEPSVEAVYANITEANRVSEEIREEDEESRTPPLEMSAV